jgi:hypothetical protein
MSGRGVLLCPPCTERPFAPLRRYLFGSNIDCYLGQRYPALFATTDSCARPLSSHRLRSPLAGGSLQIATSLCWIVALPGVISANLSLRAWTPTPAALVVHIPVFLPQDNGLPDVRTRSALATSIRQLLYGLFLEAAIIHSCSGPQICSPPRLLLPQC